jgi:hypothetical protein
VELFPFIHSVIALTVLSSSPQGEQVCLSSKFVTVVAGGEEQELDSNKDSSAGDNNLTKCQRAVLEFFIAKIRLCSQKKMMSYRKLHNYMGLKVSSFIKT